MRMAGLFRSLVISATLMVSAGSMAGEDKESVITNIVDVKNQVIAVAGADLVIGDNRISRKTKWLVGFLTKGDLEQKKAHLLEELKRESGADVIIDPQFEYTPKFLNGGTLVVNGYPAKYTKFRNLTPTEVDSLIINGKYRPGSIVFFDSTMIKTTRDKNGN